MTLTASAKNNENLTPVLMNFLITADIRLSFNPVFRQFDPMKMHTDDTDVLFTVSAMLFIE